MDEAVLLTEGSRAIVASIANQRALSFSKFRVGETVNYTPRIDDSDVQNYVFQGDANSIRWFTGDNPEVLVIELTLNSSVGDFNVGNVMVFDHNGNPFCYAVRLTPIPKIKTTSTRQGSELIIQISVRILSNEKSSRVEVYYEENAVIPVEDNEEGLLAIDPIDAPFPLYMVQNFKGTNRPALLYADALNDEWWANDAFQPIREGGFDIISGGYVGDGYARPAGAMHLGGSFSPVRTAAGNYTYEDSGKFGDDITETESAGQFGV